MYHYVYQNIREAIFCPTYLYDFGIDIMAEMVGYCMLDAKRINVSITKNNYFLWENN